eukprot:scaffold19253_cov49-Attheya_sp.AAC.2
MSLNQGEKKHPPDWDSTVKSTQTREQQKSSIDHSLQSSNEHLLICLRQKDTEIYANHFNELQVMLQETIDARKVLVESRSDARIKVLLVERSSSFPPFMTSYVGIRTLVPEILKVPEILSNRPLTKNSSVSTNIQKETTALNDNEIDVNSDDIETKTKATDILIASKIQDLCDTASADKLEVPRASSNSIFPPFSTSYEGTSSSVPALLAADTPFSPLAEILNLDKQPLEPTTTKPANPVTANLPVQHDVPVVTEEFITISTSIEVSIEEQDSPTSLPDTATSSQVKTPPFPCNSHSDAYGGTSTWPRTTQVFYSTRPQGKTATSTQSYDDRIFRG